MFIFTLAFTQMTNFYSTMSTKESINKKKYCKYVILLLLLCGDRIDATFACNSQTQTDRSQIDCRKFSKKAHFVVCSVYLQRKAISIVMAQKSKGRRKRGASDCIFRIGKFLWMRKLPLVFIPSSWGKLIYIGNLKKNFTYIWPQKNCF